MKKNRANVPDRRVCGCIVLERLTTERAEGFAAYLKACGDLAARANDQAAYSEVLLAFQSARSAFENNQRRWEAHVAEHHLG